MEDVGSLLLVLELHDDFDGNISDIGAAKSSTYLFIKQPQDKEPFPTELLDFGTI